MLNRQEKIEFKMGKINVGGTSRDCVKRRVHSGTISTRTLLLQKHS